MDHLTDAQLQAWIDRELDSAEHARLNGHLEDCASCRRDLRALRSAAETFSGAMLDYDDALAAAAADRGRVAPSDMPGSTDRASDSPPRFAPRWAGRAAALVLLLGAAAAAAMVPGSPFRGIFVDETPGTLPAPVAVDTPGIPADAGASITVRPDESRLTVRVLDFPAGTRLSVQLVDRDVAIASLPDDAPDARFIVASGLLDVIGSGASVEGSTPVGTVTLRLPRLLENGVVELDGEVVARVSGGRLSTLRQVSSTTGDGEAVFEVGG